MYYLLSVTHTINNLINIFINMRKNGIQVAMVPWISSDLRAMMTWSSVPGMNLNEENPRNLLRVWEASVTAALVKETHSQSDKITRDECLCELKEWLSRLSFLTNSGIYTTRKHKRVTNKLQVVSGWHIREKEGGGGEIKREIQWFWWQWCSRSFHLQ